MSLYAPLKHEQELTMVDLPIIGVFELLTIMFSFE